MTQFLLVGAVVLGALPLLAQEAVQKTKLATEGTAPPPPIKVALSGKALEKYLRARKTATEYLAAKGCSSFLNSHNFDAAKVSHALTAQQPQDGTASSISFAEAGILGLEPDPHRGDSIQSIFNDPAFHTIAISQPSGVDTYYNPRLLTRKIDYPYSNPVSLIHEALHNQTGESDVAIAQDLGYRGFVPLEANIFINKALKKNCDSRR